MKQASAHLNSYELLIFNKNLADLIKFYLCDNEKEFFEQMEYCLEEIINKDNYREKLSDFIISYQPWVNSYKKEYYYY
jgi:hypothetical protein